MPNIKQSFCIPCFWEDKTKARPVVERAAKIGFHAFEFWFREDIPFNELCLLAKDNGMTIASMCGHQALTSGLNKPSNHARIKDEIMASLDVAQEHNIQNLICFSGNRDGLSDADGINMTADGFALVKTAAESAGVTLIMELLNSKVDHKDYQCDSTAWGVEVIKRVDSPNVKLLYDIYHMQIMEGDLCRTIRDNMDSIGHFHTAGNPGRHDLDETQEIYYPAVAKAIADSDYTGYVAHEFTPLGNKLNALEHGFKLCDV